MERGEMNTPPLLPRELSRAARSIRRLDFHEHDPMRWDGRGEFVFENANILLPPDVANGALSVHAEVFPRCRDFFLVRTHIEQSDRERAVFERTRINERVAAWIFPRRVRGWGGRRWC